MEEAKGSFCELPTVWLQATLAADAVA